MSIRRRALRGSPLLVSAAGAVVTIACAGGGRTPPGNLMAPPQVTVCVAATPPEAPVTVDGNPVDETGCTSVYSGSTVVIDAQLEGYQPYHEEIQAQDGVRHEIVLVPVATEPAPAE
jgi:hypothetical protein